MHPKGEHVRLLLSKAAEDEAALVVLLGHGPATLMAAGFHAQQAVEKLLKAALCSRGVDYPKTHIIRVLLDLLQEAGTLPPEAVRPASALTPYAVEFRYDALPSEGVATLDPAAVLRLVGDVRAWVEGLLAETDHARDA